MKYLVSLYFLFGLFQVSSAQTTPKFATAIEYNDYIIELQKKIGVAINDISESIDSGSLSYSTAKLEALKKVTDQSIAKLKAMPAFKGNTGFRDASLRLFQFYKATAENEYKEMINLIFASPRPPDFEDKLNAIVQQVQEKESKFDEVFQSEQEKFAKANNFTLSTD